MVSFANPFDSDNRLNKSKETQTTNENNFETTSILLTNYCKNWIVDENRRYDIEHHQLWKETVSYPFNRINMVFTFTNIVTNEFEWIQFENTPMSILIRRNTVVHSELQRPRDSWVSYYQLSCRHVRECLMRANIPHSQYKTESILLSIYL